MSPPTSTVQPRVLIVEDLKDTRESLQEFLRLVLQENVDTAEDGTEALTMLAEREYTLVITDLRMPRINGMQLLREIRDRDYRCAVIITTGHVTVKEAVEAMKLGASDVLEKPVNPQHLAFVAEQVLRARASVAAG